MERLRDSDSGGDLNEDDVQTAAETFAGGLPGIQAALEGTKVSSSTSMKLLRMLMKSFLS